MPNRARATMRCCEPGERLRAERRVDGAVPNARVSCPSPAGSSRRGRLSPVISCWCGATSAPSSDAPIQMP
jgi:hypothetical protein